MNIGKFLLKLGEEIDRYEDVSAQLQIAEKEFASLEQKIIKCKADLAKLEVRRKDIQQECNKKARNAANKARETANDRAWIMVVDAKECAEKIINDAEIKAAKIIESAQEQACNAYNKARVEHQILTEESKRLERSMEFGRMMEKELHNKIDKLKITLNNLPSQYGL